MDFNDLGSRDLLTPALAKAILDQASQVDRAAALEGQNSPPFSVQVITIDLTTAKTIQDPFVIGFGFRSVFVREMTDSIAKVSLRPYSPDSLQGDISLKNNDSLVFPKTVPKGFLSWEAQSGKTATLVFFMDGEFRSGSQVSSTAGGVSITTGTAMTPGAPVAVSTVTQIVATDSTRKQVTIGNPRNSGVDLWISGTSAVLTETGATPGILLEPGDYYVHQGQGPIYGITTGAVCNVTVQTEA